MEGISCFRIPENRKSLLFFLSRVERQMRYKLKVDLHHRLEKIFGFSFTLFNDRNSISTFINKNLNFNPDLVITLSKGGSFRPHHALLQIPELHAKWLAYMHDPYPMHLYPRPFAWVEPGYYKKWKFIKDVSERASFSAFPSLLLKDWMGSYFPNFLNTGIVIPHQTITHIEREVIKSNFLNQNYFNLLHAGTLLSQRNPKFLVKAFKLFLDKEPKAHTNAKLIFIGGESIFTPWLKSMLEEIPGLVLSDGYLPFDQVLHMQKLADVNIILEAKSEISPFLPGKFPHCVQAKKPILLLGPYYSESKRLLGAEYPFWAESDDVEAISLIIRQLYREWKIDRVLKMERQDLIEYLSPKNLERTISNCLS